MSRTAPLLMVLLVLPALVPYASAGVTYTWMSWTSADRPAHEFLIGDTIRIDLHVTSDDQTFTLDGTLKVYQETSSGDHARATLQTDPVTVSPGPMKKLTWTWSTSGAPSSWAGPYRADVDTPGGTRSYHFDLSHTPDLRVSFLRITHDPLFGVKLLREGHEKVVEACVENAGPEELVEAEVGLFFRLLVDPLVSGHAYQDWRPGHVVATETIRLDEWGFHNRCRASAIGIDAPGYYVRFEWDTTDIPSLTQGSPAMTRVGVRGDPHDVVFEVNEGNNDRDAETTIMPWPLLP